MDGAEPDADGREADAASRFTEDLILEILSRLPAKSLHRFKCVSRQWLALISDPNHRAKMAQPLAGFFYIGYDTDYNHPKPVPVKSLHLTSARADPPPLIDPSALSVPSSCWEHLYRIDCSNGLVLLHYWMATPPEHQVHRYTVCNPATDEWTAVPESPTRGVASLVRLAVDPTASASSPLHFRVFEFRSERGVILSAEIYSSESGTWTHRECGWDVGVGISLRDNTSGVCFGGMLHLSPIEPVFASVDGDGNTWKTSRKPSNPDDSCFLGGPEPGLIGLSQGRLHFFNTMARDSLKLCNWELDDNGFWVMKHSVDLRKVFTDRWNFRFGVKFRVIGIHPDSNIVYFVQGKNNTLISCATDRGEGCVIRDLGNNNYGPYLPYVPLFSAPLAIRALESVFATCSLTSDPVVILE